ncbi:MAG: ABC transporter permease, partial [Lachnospiraceae bacterium]|nr:ABC transporter permease [Lachnospiraceae bacterium]
MIKYSLKRLARSLFSFALVVAVVFCLLRMMPIEGYFSEYDKMTETQIQNELEKMGLTDPIYIQLGRFYLQLLHGNLGVSNKYRVNYPIAKIIAKKAPLSIRFGLMAMAISFPGGILLGVFMARKKGGWIDRLGTGYIIQLQAVPSAEWDLFIKLSGT